MPVTEHRLAAFCLCLVVLVLAGCASDRSASPRVAGTPLAQARGADENAKLYTDLIRQLISQDRLYAALAHLQAREQEFGVDDELRLLRADILRKMGERESAEALYKKLLDTDYDAQANHGLGLIYANDDIARGTRYLQRAVDAAPTNAQMRNDLGYALLREGRMGQARIELTTAYQLDQDNELNRNNYILLLLSEGRNTRAARIAAASGVSDATMAQLRTEAGQLTPSAAITPAGKPRPSDTPGAIGTGAPAPPVRQTSPSAAGVGGGGG
ncbi:hypothetical protein [Salinisphaera sp. T31B1]|uniref:hypothetical protein n=1 Tax=Salinisphaera sp. T31B1 TaxID=727963 RepID=UPI003340F16A